MAKVDLNRTTFTSLAISAKVLVQFRGGSVQLADTASPADEDWVTVSNGTLVVLEVNKYARATGIFPTFASAVTL
jgi:hypothetical protein